MAEKLLMESSWKAFAKGRTLDDAALVKSLVSLSRAGDNDSAARLKALDALDSALTALRRSNKNDKAVLDHLGDLQAAAARTRKETVTAAESDSSDEDDTPELLTSKMLPLVRELRKGEARMHALVSTAGKATAVLIMRRPIASSRRKLMQQALDVASGAQHITGECLLEAGALTFVIQGSANNLARRIREALLAQLGLRLKIRVRGDNGVAEEDGEFGDQSVSDDPAAPQSPSSQGEPPEGADARAPFDRALAVLQPLLDEALRQQHPQAGKLRAVRDFASGKAEAGDIPAALKALATLKQMMNAPVTAGPPSGSAAVGGARDTALAAWRETRATIIAGLRDLAREIAASGEPEARGAIIELSAVIKQLTNDPATPQQVEELMRWIDQDAVVADVDTMDRPLREPLKARLLALQTTMSPP